MYTGIVADRGEIVKAEAVDRGASCGSGLWLRPTVRSAHR